MSSTIKFIVLRGNMIPKKISLWDSVTLNAITTDKFKTGVISMTLHLPLTPKNAAHNMLISGVMRRGTEKFKNAAALNRALDELYATTVEFKSSRCGKNCLLTLSAEMLDNAFIPDGTDVLDGTAHILSQMLLCPLKENGVFTDEAVSKEKTNLIDSIKAETNNPRAYASSRCLELMHRDDPDFPTFESMLADVSGASASTLYGYYQQLLCDSSLNIYYVGSESSERVAEVIKHHFSEFHGKKMPPTPISAEKFLGSIERTEPMAVLQGKLSMGFRTGICANEKKYFAAVVFNEIFGGTPASKLFMNVREKMSLCYYCASRYDSYTGNLTVAAGINVCDREKTYNAILEQLDQIRNGNISDTEMAAAKEAIAHSFRQIYDYPLDLISFYSNKAIFDIEASPEEYGKLFNDVTKEDVVNVAKDVKLDSVFFLEGTLEGEEDVCDE